MLRASPEEDKEYSANSTLSLELISVKSYLALELLFQVAILAAGTCSLGVMNKLLQRYQTPAENPFLI